MEGKTKRFKGYKKMTLSFVVLIAIGLFFFAKGNVKRSDVPQSELSNITASEISDIEILPEGNIIDANSTLRVSLMLDDSYIYNSYLMGLREDGALSISLHKRKSSSTDKIDYIDIPMDIVNQLTNKKIEKIVIINDQQEEIQEIKL